MPLKHGTLGHWFPQSGDILVNGHNLKDLELKTFLKKIGSVDQEVNLFDKSIRENISYGTDRLLSDEELTKIAKMARIDAFYKKLEHGWDTIVGERGAKVSGGEKQRIGIARALCSQPGLIVLDEATSALDGTSEIAITEALGKLKGVVTTIVIAHRLTSVKECDRIIYLEHGKIVAIGTLNELRKKIPDLEAQLLNLEEVANSQL